MKDRERSGDWVELREAGEIPEGGLQDYAVRGRCVVVGRRAGRLFAVEGICPHAGAPLAEGSLEGPALVCPLHGYAFDVRSGRCLDDETLRIDTFEVLEKDGRARIRPEPRVAEPRRE